MIRRQVVIPASPDRVWEALTDPEAVSGWFGGEFDWELTEGSQLHFRGENGDVREGRVDEVRSERRLRFVWWPAGDVGDASEISYLLEPTDEGVRLTVQERPVPPAALPTPGPTARASADGMASQDESPRWTAWDTRLAGAWAGVAEVSRARA